MLASLRKHGFEDKTLTIYTSDQGPEWPRSTWTLYDTGLRVPFIARWPGQIPRGAKRFRTEIYASHSGDGTRNMFPRRCVRDLRYKCILNLHPERKWTTHFTKVDDSKREDTCQPPYWFCSVT